MRQYRLQRRQHPLFSPVALISTLVLMFGLGFGVLFTGGRAFSPGDLSAVNSSGITLGDFLSHADFNDECARCHDPFQGIGAAKCEACHQDVAQERQTLDGLHGRLEKVEKCARCHSEHQGVEFDLFATALANWDHNLAQFSLAYHREDYEGIALDCTTCHAGEKDLTLLPGSCTECHRANNAEFIRVHSAAYGDDCLACHDGIDTLADFSSEDHANVFALLGAHEAVTCEGCHVAGQFEGTPDQCASCHAEPAIHQAVLGTDCNKCHTSEGWKPATLDGLAFDHAVNTRFHLDSHIVDYDNTAFTCLTCHSDQQFQFTEADCADCHAKADFDFIADHSNQAGTACLNCHDGTGQIANFDHSTTWPLVGEHLLLECTACHIDQLASETPGECQACHEEPQIHFGIFGTDCATCHTAEGWFPARLTRHVFPLDHGEQGEVACATCHQLNYAGYSCYGCHEHEQVEIESEHISEGITFPELTECAKCHPTGHKQESENGG